MIWKIITDSSSDIFDRNFSIGEDEIQYKTVPFVITVDTKDYVDDEKVSVDELLSAMEKSEKASHTSCPSPAAWADAFRGEENVIAITISKELSGSYNSACAARDMILEEDPEKKIVIVNSFSTGPGIILMLRKIYEYIEQGCSFDEVAKKTLRDGETNHTSFALCSFRNLIKNGRMPKLVGFFAQKLKLWGIGIASEEGKIEVIDKTRGAQNAVKCIIRDMLERRSPEECVMISHCQNPELAGKLKEEVLARWPKIDVEIYETRGLCSYYAERKGLIVAYK